MSSSLFSSGVKHTSIEAAEQALPNSRARAGGRVIAPARSSRHRELVAVVGRRSLAPTHLLSVPVRCTSHQRLHARSLEAGAPSLGRFTD
jgi:hypothetical protein